MKKNRFTFWLLLGLFTAAGYADSIHFDTRGEERLLLNGTWKFQTFPGDGAGIITNTARDIIVDNADSQLVEVNGRWTVKTEPERASLNRGDDYLARWFNEGDPDSNVKFRYKVPERGLYDHYIYYPFGHHLTARVRIQHVKGTTVKHVSQRNRCNQWVFMGTYEIDPLQDAFTEFSAITPGGLVADAVMLRPVDAAERQESAVEKARALQAHCDDAAWPDLLVPGHWGMNNEFSNYTGKGLYRRRFSLPNWKPNDAERIRLKFDAVYHVARVYLNGQFIGQHRGGFTPFEFDVTDKLNYGGENVLAVEADNSAIVGATWNWGGIIRDVYLTRNTDVRSNYLYAHAEPDLDSGTADLTIKVRVENDSATNRNLLVESVLLDESIVRTLALGPKETREVVLRTSLNADQVKLWHFDFPHLYQLTTRVSENGTLLHQRQDTFGIRKLELTESQFLLNGEPVRLGGYNRVSDHRYWGSSEPLELLEADVKLMKDAGANFMRIMHGTQNKALMDLCDREGILVIEEINVRELSNPEFTAPNYPLARQWLVEMIERDINHPSIIGWSVGNELSDHFEYVQQAIDFVKEELDPHRLVSCVSNTGHRKKDTAENDPLGLSDLILQNCYMKAPTFMIEQISEKWPQRPIFFSEFGIGRFDEPTLDGDLPGLTDWYSQIRGANTHVVGAALWTYNDYRSGYSQTLQEENRAWGLVNVWRQKRRLYARQQRELSPVKGLVINEASAKRGQATVTIPIREADDYPSYTMRGYSLDWELRNEAGVALRSGRRDLPVLRPGDQSWTGPLSWEPLAEKPFDFRIRLLSANGYTRYDVVTRFQAPSKPGVPSVIAGDQSVRVNFQRPSGADEVFVRYTDRDGRVAVSKKTIDSQLDLRGLVNGRLYQIELVAVNAFGESPASEAVTVIAGGRILPPIVWHTMKRDQRIILGYSGDWGDEHYTVRYGSSADALDQEIQATARGMMTIDWTGGDAWLQIRRVNQGRESAWSRVVKVESGILGVD